MKIQKIIDYGKHKVYKMITKNKVYPNENFDSFTEYWDALAPQFPRRADIETVNSCNALCVCCLQQTMTKPRGLMSLETFKVIADKLKLHNCLIRGMYTTGEPLMDPTLFEKYAYARQIKVMASYVSLNTNVSLLEPTIFKKILDNTDNITLSFFNVGEEYERITGGLSWEKNYRNALAFIKFRDLYRPDYRIFIGCNRIQPASLKAVKDAFKGCNVEWAIDAELRWSGSVITGIIDRAIMYPTFRCDGHEGVLMIKWNGNIEACSYDFKEETLYSNIFTDDWETIRRKFFANWKKPFRLCARCDNWNLYWRVKRNHFKYVDDKQWQIPFLKEGEALRR